ncbi:hypothetical protein FB45DRAFT_1068539 [Roridomyces roridus]|uniref:Zn(2)-C6 fungal-type domain-containing protein n=1 Tax=Roridomyces roridus TaxID=1738132 RepID=A0AAD7F758_9AGAR|nr:hypothetical protein FB45DRAFT_1068539 [Roridomyces roridus]
MSPRSKASKAVDVFVDSYSSDEEDRRAQKKLLKIQEERRKLEEAEERIAKEQAERKRARERRKREEEERRMKEEEEKRVEVRMEVESLISDALARRVAGSDEPSVREDLFAEGSHTLSEPVLRQLAVYAQAGRSQISKPASKVAKSGEKQGAGGRITRGERNPDPCDSCKTRGSTCHKQRFAKRPSPSCYECQRKHSSCSLSGVPPRRTGSRAADLGRMKSRLDDIELTLDRRDKEERTKASNSRRTRPVSDSDEEFEEVKQPPRKRVALSS